MNGSAPPLPSAPGDRFFTSYWQAGFEGADHINGSGEPLHLARLNNHLDRVDDDYAALASFSIRTVRESVGWRVCESSDTFDFSDVHRRCAAANRHGLQIIWTICHYGIPDDLDYFSPELPQRFGRFCDAFARFVAPLQDERFPSVFVPVNEISFLTWAVCETGLMSTHVARWSNDSDQLKIHLCDAALRGTHALRAVIPNARFMHVDPLIHVVSDRGEHTRAEARSQSQFEALDMLLGRREPQLGGDVDCVDVVGLNYYHSNQWELHSDDCLHWHLNDRRRKPLADLLADVAARVAKPIAIAETSHVGDGRGRWISYIARELRDAAERHVHLDGVCLYPIVDRPDWEETTRWHRSGLWDVDTQLPQLPRRLDAAYAHHLKHAQALLDAAHGAPRDSVNQESSMTLIVYSHLRWDFVFQRPQHLMTRLAAHARIVFVEEPLVGEHDGVERLTPFPNVDVLRLHTSRGERGFDEVHVDALQTMVRDYLRQENLGSDVIAWFYTPIALPLLKGLAPKAVIYDCMDELSAFKNAPPKLLERERELLDMANAVFTGGPSLYEARRDRNAQTHCFSSSVDLAHFTAAKNAGVADPRFAFDGPVLGFFGVIDERLNIDLVRDIAALRPHWHFCYVGPVVKIDPATLPQAPNIHYFPQQSYASLPSILAAWDVSLMPFAINEATKFISPTKTLEYLAAGKPVVSTPIRDVVTLYGDCVWIADDAESFVQACEEALHPLPPIRRTAIEKTLARTSWDRTAAAMRSILQSALTNGLTPPAKRYIAAKDRIDPVACLIIGAGPTGLSAAYHLGEGSLLVEAGNEVGGWCRSYTDSGFQFDYAGHIMFSNDPYVHSMYSVLLGDNVHWQDREAWVYSKNVYTRYPFQGALYGLPPAVLKECLVGAIEARFGNLDGTRDSGALDKQASDEKTDCCADGVVLSDSTVTAIACVRHERLTSPANFEDFIYRVWGTGVAKHFAIPYNTKLWTVPLSTMETSWLGTRVPLPNMEQMIEGALSPVAKPMGPNARFGYPLRGGFQALMDGFLPHLRGNVVLGKSVTRVQPATHTAWLNDGTHIDYDRLISTMPLPQLIGVCDEVPADIRAAVSGLKHVSIRCVNLGIGRTAISDKHWIYYPEDAIFHRIFLQGNASPHCNPPGGFGLTCEISYSPTKPLPVDGDALFQRCIEDCIRVGIFNQDDPIWAASQVDMPYAYVVYDHARAANVERVRTWLGENDIVLAGRYSEWEYYNSDHAFIAGKTAAEAVAGDGANALSLIA